MKKYTKILALALALTMMLSMSVFAAGEKIASVTTKNGASTIGDAAALVGAEKFGLTYSYTETDSDPVKDEMFLLLVLLGEEVANPLPDKDNILYVNQGSGNGTVTFSNVYPSRIDNATIYLAGGDLGKLTPIGSIAKQESQVTVLWGDVNSDKNRDMTDISLLLQYINGAPVLVGDQITAADVTGDSNQDMSDVSYILQFINGDIQKFPVEEK